MLIGAISDTVHAKAERFNRDTTRKYENQTSEQATLAALKGSILAAAERCEAELLPQQLQGLKGACAKESLSARWAKFESQSQAQRVTRLQAREAEVHQQATLHDTQLVQQKAQFNEECYNNKVPGFQQESQ